MFHHPTLVDLTFSILQPRKILHEQPMDKDIPPTNLSQQDAVSGFIKESRDVPG
jgi:hypothetical protein